MKWKYKVEYVVEANLIDLEKAVNKLLKEGWRVVGAPFREEWKVGSKRYYRWYQSMKISLIWNENKRK